VRLLRHPSPLPEGTAACIGAFDGLHLGHQALLCQAAALAPRVALVTFEPHPAQILAPERAPPRLQTPGQRARVAAALGVDTLVLLPFTRALAETSPDEFAAHLLRDGLRPAAVVVGPDFRFGAGRRGDPDLLRRLLAPAGITVAVAPEIPGPPDPDGSPHKLGSSGIRRAVIAGDLTAAAAMLGRPYSVEGEVVHGARRGRTLGFPTANVASRNPLLPPTGVYAGALAVVSPGPHRGALWPAVINIGHNPTFTPGPDAPRTLEVHALDIFLGDALYGTTVEVAFAARLRDELRFPSAEALTAQIARDITAARPRLTPAWLAGAVLGLDATCDEDHV
jgi:riboflavin kinase/FMN adenylyltransferase